MAKQKKWNKLYNEMVSLLAKNLAGTATDKENRRFCEVCQELKNLAI